MQKRVIGLLIIFISFIFLSGFVNAAVCDVRLRTNCNTAPFNNIVMGLSAFSNAHGQNATGVTLYDYVLCCDFAGDNICKTTPFSNKIIGLSSLTNAHAEIPTGSVYTTKICYDGLECTSASVSSCSETNPLYPLPILSLSSSTNAHLANFSGTGSYSTKICCKDNSGFVAPDCDLSNAYWQYAVEVIEGTDVGMILEGADCFEGTGAAVNFSVYKQGGAGTLVESVIGNFDQGTWTTKLTNPTATENYYFNATAMISRSSLLSLTGTPTQNRILKVVPEEEYCLAIGRCTDYLDAPTCNSDRCDVAPKDVNCPTNNPDVICSCGWNPTGGPSGTGVCEFNIDYPPVPVVCENGFTLCNTNPGKTSGVDYCYPGNTCRPGNQTLVDGDRICDPSVENNGEGCYTSDCQKPGDVGACNQTAGNTCQSGKCSNGKTPKDVTGCGHEFTLCHNPAANLNYCFPGSKCPPGDNPVEDANTLCNLGDGCSSSDCIAGGTTMIDSCLGGYCGTGLNAGTCFSPTATQGTCVYHETTTDDCADGILQYSWTVEWLPSPAGEPQPADCVLGSRVIPCAAQVQLPFFGICQIFGTIAVIIIVYIAIALVRKNRHVSRKKVQRRKKRK